MELYCPCHHTPMVSEPSRFADVAGEAHTISDNGHSEHDLACQNTRSEHLACVRLLLDVPGTTSRPVFTRVTCFMIAVCRIITCPMSHLDRVNTKVKTAIGSDRVEGEPIFNLWSVLNIYVIAMRPEHVYAG